MYSGLSVVTVAPLRAEHHWLANTIDWGSEFNFYGVALGTVAAENELRNCSLGMRFQSCNRQPMLHTQLDGNSFRGSWGLHFLADGRFPPSYPHPTAPTIAHFAVRRTTLRGDGWFRWSKGVCTFVTVNGSAAHGVVEHVDFDPQCARDPGNRPHRPGVYVSGDARGVVVR